METELNLANDREKELERKRVNAEEQISLLTSKMDMIHSVVDHQQVELKKSKVYIESLEDKHKVVCVYVVLYYKSGSYLYWFGGTDNKEETISSADSTGSARPGVHSSERGDSKDQRAETEVAGRSGCTELEQRGTSASVQR